MTKQIIRQSNLITYLFALSIFFFIFQFAAYLTLSRDMQFLFSLLTKGTMKVPANVYLAQVGFVLAQLSLYAAFTGYVWLVARLLGSFFKLSWQATCRLGFCFWLLCAVTVLFANQMFYPASAFSILMEEVFPKALTGVICWLFLVVIAAATVLAFVEALKRLWRKKPIFSVIFLIMSSLIGFSFYHMGEISLVKSPPYDQQPNVIIIGVDSLRPDYVDFDGYKGGSPITPNIDKVLKGAMNFTQAYTPLARTFPSWVSILTGKYPPHNGVRFNLADQARLSFNESLAAILKKHGYKTYYATDDRRFSNVSKKFGFDAIVGPKTGANDFVLGTVNDMPLSNLIINTWLGRLLFPYNFGNRASYANYYPQTFNKLVEKKLAQQTHRPIFLSIHFCLPHWPYAWAKGIYNSHQFPVGLYSRAVQRSDLQVKHFMAFLKRDGLLKHAIVILLSDHGEALLKPHDRAVDESQYIKGPHSVKNIFKKTRPLFVIKGHEFDTSYGHGTDVLSLVQYHTVLAFRTFGLKHKNAIGKSDHLVSLVDIEPTLLAMLKIKTNASFDGSSQAATVYGDQTTLASKPVFMETGFTPQSATSSGLSLHGMVIKGAKVFEINKEDMLELKPQMASLIIKSKQRQVVYKKWILALYPQAHGRVVSVLVNRQTGYWTDDLTSPFAKKAPVAYLLAQLKKLYGKEVSGRCPFKGPCV